MCRTMIPILTSSNLSQPFTILVNSAVGQDMSSLRGPVDPALSNERGTMSNRFGPSTRQSTYVSWLQFRAQRKMLSNILAVHLLCLRCPQLSALQWLVSFRPGQQGEIRRQKYNMRLARSLQRKGGQGSECRQARAS